MNYFTKATWYDWNGFNQWLFEQINSIHNNTYDLAMLLLSRVGDHRNFAYYLIGLAVFALLIYFYRKVFRHGGTPYLLAAWFAVFVMLIAGFAMEAFVVHYLKDYFSYPRPYMVSSNVRILEMRPIDDNYHSFPSGHVAFITLMVVGLWPVMSGLMKWLGVLLIVGVAWSRMALGVHFPADVVGTFLLMFLLLLIVRYIVYRILRRVAGLRC